MRLRSWVIVVAAVAIVASACSSTDSNASLRDAAVAGAAQERSTPPSSQAVDQDERLAVARVGAKAGGIVELAGRARLTIPPGALTDDAEVRLTAIGSAPSDIAFPLEQALAPPVKVEIRRAELTKPATLELLFDTDVVVLPDDPVIATPSQWVDDSWVQFDARIDADEGVVSLTSETPNGWWRPSVWDWSRLPAVVDALFVGLDEAEVPQPACTTPVPGWVDRVELSEAAVDPAYFCAGGFEGQLAVRLTNRRPFTLAVDSTQAPAWGWTNTSDQVHLLLSEIVRSAQPGFEPQFILPRFTEGAVGIEAGNFPGGRIFGEATSTTMAIDVAVLVLEALGGGSDLADWKPLLACAIPTADDAVDPSEASKIVERLWRCARRFSGSDRLPPGFGAAVVAVLDLLVQTDSFADGVEDMMKGSGKSSGALYWTDPSLVKDEPTPTTTTLGDEPEPLPLPLPPSSFAPTTPTPPRTSPLPRPVPIPPVPTTQPPAPPTTKKPPPTQPPTTRPPPTQPPTTRPPPTQPPTTRPPPTLPPTTRPPTTLPPTTRPPTTLPATTAPPTTQPPTTLPPTTPPPTTAPRRGKGRGRGNNSGDDD